MKNRAKTIPSSGVVAGTGDRKISKKPRPVKSPSGREGAEIGSKRVSTFVLSVLLLASSRGRADTVGVGNFTIDIDISAGIPAPYQAGTITFDGTTRNVFGTPVNLATQVG